MLLAVKVGEIPTPNRALGQILQQQSKQKFKTTQKLTTKTHGHRTPYSYVFEK